MAVANSGASLTSVTTAQAGSAITFTSVCKQHALHVVVSNYTGGGKAIVSLEVSMDNVNWFSVAPILVVTTNGNHYLTNSSPLPALYCRANLVSITPGTSLTLSAQVACE